MNFWQSHISCWTLFMVFTITDHRNNAITWSKLKWNHKPRQNGSLPHFEHFMSSFLWSKRDQNMKKSGRFVFHSNAKKYTGRWNCFFLLLQNCQKHTCCILQIPSFSRSILSLHVHSLESNSTRKFRQLFVKKKRKDYSTLLLAY